MMGSNEEHISDFGDESVLSNVHYQKYVFAKALSIYSEKHLPFFLSEQMDPA